MNKTEVKIKGWKRILLLIIPYFFVVGTFQLIGMAITGIDFTNPNHQANSIQELIISIFDFLGTFLILCLFMKYIDRERFITLGFQTKNRLNEFIVGILIGFVIMLLGYGILISLNEIFYIKMSFDYKELLFLILIYTIVAFVEETLFRGYILRNLMNSFNNYIALIISAILFSLMHSFNPNVNLFSLFDLFLAGLTLGLSYIYTKNLWFPIAMHFSWNLFQSLFGFNVSGQNTYSIIEIGMNEMNLINGGSFGFEGSYLSIIAEIITIIGIGIYYNNNANSQKLKANILKK